MNGTDFIDFLKILCEEDESSKNSDKKTDNDILNIFEHLAKDENKCIIIVTHSQNVCDRADIVYELKK